MAIDFLFILYTEGDALFRERVAHGLLVEKGKSSESGSFTPFFRPFGVREIGRTLRI